MAFKNEYVPPLEQETSEFFKKAQKTLNVMAEARSKWTVDREREMVLFCSGRGHSLESAGESYWLAIDHKGTYSFTTERLHKHEVSPEEIAIAYRLKHFWVGGGESVPDSSSLASIKEALREYKDWGVISDYKRCQLTLIDAKTGKEI
jgi:hypothetical protein